MDYGDHDAFGSCVGPSGWRLFHRACRRGGWQLEAGEAREAGPLRRARAAEGNLSFKFAIILLGSRQVGPREPSWRLCQREKSINQYCLARAPAQPGARMHARPKQDGRLGEGPAPAAAAVCKDTDD